MHECIIVRGRALTDDRLKRIVNSLQNVANALIGADLKANGVTSTTMEAVEDGMTCNDAKHVCTEC